MTGVENAAGASVGFAERTSVVAVKRRVGDTNFGRSAADVGNTAVSGGVVVKCAGINNKFAFLDGYEATIARAIDIFDFGIRDCELAFIKNDRCSGSGIVVFFGDVVVAVGAIFGSICAEKSVFWVEIGVPAGGLAVKFKIGNFDFGAGGDGE